LETRKKFHEKVNCRAQEGKEKDDPDPIPASAGSQNMHRHDDLEDGNDPADGSQQLQRQPMEPEHA
jgi:hypothetical protein